MRIRILVPLLLIALGATAQGKKTVFSTMETNHIRVATPGLFSQRELIELPLEDIPDTEYSFPLPGGKVISPYGRGRGRHSGIDIKTYAKDTIRSAFNGVVRMSKPYSAYGNVVVVRHDFGLETIYSHNFKNLVHCGDTVKAGQPIALTGRTGRASTEHLHFETRVNGQHFDPNIMQLKWEKRAVEQDDTVIHDDIMKEKGPYGLFTDFYELVTGKTMSEEQEAVMRETAEQAEEEVS